MIWVALFSALDFHGPILSPVREPLTDRADTLLTADRRAIVGFRPHVLVRRLLFGPLEHVRLGLRARRLADRRLVTRPLEGER